MLKLGMGKKIKKIEEFTDFLPVDTRTGSALLKPDKKASRETSKAIKKELKKNKEVDGMGSLKQTMGIIFTIITFAFGAGMYMQKMQSGIETQGVILNKIANGMDKRTEKVHSLDMKVLKNAGDIKINATRLKMAEK